MVQSGSQGRARGAVLRLLAVGALMAIAVAVSAPVGAAGDNDQVGCIPINYTTCVQPVSGTTTTTAPTYTAPTYGAPTQTLPGNSLVTTYVDPRYCGDGLVSLVTDSTGHVINVCTDTGVRIYPVFPDFGGYGGYFNGYFGNGNAVYGNRGVPYSYNWWGAGTAYAPAYLNGNYAYTGAPVAPLTGNFVNGYFGAPYAFGGYNQYTDNRFCGDGQITQTPQGYFCTTSGVPAYRSA